MNRLLQEIDQGIQEYQADAQEHAARRQRTRLLARLLSGEFGIQGIFYRRTPPRPDTDRPAAASRFAGRPILWS